MSFLKKNIFGLLAILVGIYLLINSISNINEILNYEEFYAIGEYVAVKQNMEPNLMSGVIKMSLVFLLFLLIPVVLSVLHKRRKANNKILYIAIVFIVANFLVFPYLLTLFYNTTKSI
ncbi:hypothetical protein [Psychroserpens sp. MEBiC05023]